jgi:ABC-2 type transport system permease protein
MRHIANIYRLGVKELWSLARDPMMVVLIVFSFTFMVYAAATSQPETLHMAPIAIVDEDGSPLSARIAGAFYPPLYTAPSMISLDRVDRGMDVGDYTFALDIPPDFQRDVLAGKSPALQLNVDATRVSLAFSGSGYTQQIALEEISDFVQRVRGVSRMPVDLALRMRFNPTLDRTWFGALNEIINDVTLLSIVLTGAALIREREHGTIEHLLVMPVTPAEIMVAKVWSMGLVVLVAAVCSLMFMVHGVMHVPIEGSVLLFVLGASLHLFATTAMGIYMATLARNMPQFGMLLILTVMPLQMLSGGTTPRESMPDFIQTLMLAAPTTHFVELGQAILYRGAGIEVVWKPFLYLLVIGSILFALSLARFRKTISQMA